MLANGTPSSRKKSIHLFSAKIWHSVDGQSCDQPFESQIAMNQITESRSDA